jgi:predicted AAA+ superfamily ATPase
LQEKKSLDFSFEWFENYLKTYIERDVRQIRNIRDLTNFQKTIRLLNARIGNKLNLRHLSKEADISYSTLNQFFNTLIVSYQFFLLPAYYTNINKRLVKHPKIYNTDVGFAAFLMDLSTAEKAETFGKLGALVENKIIADLKTLLSVFLPKARIFYFSVHEGIEIDLVIEYENNLYPIEIKATSVVKNSHLRGIRRFMQIFDNVPFGIVAYLGNTLLEVDKNIFLVPVKNILC